MKEQYIKQVEKELHISRKAKKDVIRDLNEIFSSALENGETEQQVIERLGTPKEFAENTAEQLGVNVSNFYKRKSIISSGIALVIAVVAFAIYGLAKIGNAPKDAIGYSNATTNITIDGSLWIDITPIALTIGIVAIIVAAILIIRTIKKKGK